MNDPRNDYGFPLAGLMNGQTEGQANACNFLAMLNSSKGSAFVGYGAANARQPTKLERAQAIAADVRARKFPPVQRITQKD